MCEIFNAEALGSKQLDTLRGKFDYNKTITIPIYMITPIPYCRI